MIDVLVDFVAGVWLVDCMGVVGLDEDDVVDASVVPGGMEVMRDDDKELAPAEWSELPSVEKR